MATEALRGVAGDDERGGAVMFGRCWRGFLNKRGARGRRVFWQFGGVGFGLAKRGGFGGDGFPTGIGKGWARAAHAARLAKVEILGHR